MDNMQGARDFNGEWVMAKSQVGCILMHHFPVPRRPVDWPGELKPEFPDVQE
jgi:hypothetical protein